MKRWRRDRERECWKSSWRGMTERRRGSGRLGMLMWGAGARAGSSRASRHGVNLTSVNNQWKNGLWGGPSAEETLEPPPAGEEGVRWPSLRHLFPSKLEKLTVSISKHLKGSKSHQKHVFITHKQTGQLTCKQLTNYSYDIKSRWTTWLVFVNTCGERS